MLKASYEISNDIIRNYDNDRFFWSLGLQETGKLFNGDPTWSGVIDVEAELVAILSQEISTEIDKEILKTLTDINKKEIKEQFDQQIQKEIDKEIDDRMLGLFFKTIIGKQC